MYLEDLVKEIRTQIRDNGATTAFSDAELQTFAMDSIRQYSRYRPRKRPYTLNLVATQSQYTLPSDWMTVDGDSFSKAVQPQPSTGLYGVYAYEFSVMMTVPSNLGLRSIQWKWYDDDALLVADPAPQADATLNFDYNAAHQVTLSTANPAQQCTVPDYMFPVALLWGCSQALEALLIDKSKLGVYRLGSSTSSGIEVNNEEVMKTLRALSDNFMQRWQNELMERPIGIRAGDLTGLMTETQYGGPYGAW